MTVTVNTTEYEFSTGRKPRGTGAWAFEVAGEVVFAPGCQPFSAAKKWAVATARAAGARTVTVMP